MDNIEIEQLIDILSSNEQLRSELIYWLNESGYLYNDNFDNYDFDIDDNY